MVALLVAQGLLALAAIALVTRQTRRLTTLSSLDSRAMQAMQACARDGVNVSHESRRRLERLSKGPSAAARIGRALLEAVDEGVDPGLRLDEELTDLRFRVRQDLRAVRVFGSFGSITALMGAGWQFLWLTSGRHGLADLVPGLPLRLATERATLTASAGFAIAIFCLGAFRVLSREGGALSRELGAHADRLERLHDLANESAEAPEAS